MSCMQKYEYNSAPYKGDMKFDFFTQQASPCYEVSVENTVFGCEFRGWISDLKVGFVDQI